MLFPCDLLTGSSWEAWGAKAALTLSSRPDLLVPSSSLGPIIQALRPKGSTRNFCVCTSRLSDQIDTLEKGEGNGQSEDPDTMATKPPFPNTSALGD